MVDLSVIIVNYNNFGVLEACLPSLVKALEGVEAEVIVSDNGSSDGSLAWIRQNFSSFRTLENNANLGFAEANNRAFALAGGRNILLLNPDTVVGDGAIKAMIKVLEENRAAGAVGCKLLNGDGSRQISARTFPTLMTYTWEISGLSFKYPDNRTLARFNIGGWDGASDRSVDWVTGAALMVRREVMDRVGGLDPYFFLTYDEIDWCHRIKEAGYEVWYTAKGEITHLDRQSEPQANPKPEARIKYMTVERNSRVRYFVKHHGRVYAMTVELLHLVLGCMLLLKAGIIGTKRPGIDLMERRLLLVLYWRTVRRIPRVVWNAISRLVLRQTDRPQTSLFINPYTTNDR